MVYLVKFYEHEEDVGKKAPFAIEEIVGTMEEVLAKAEEIRQQINAVSFKIKENK